METKTATLTNETESCPTQSPSLTTEVRTVLKARMRARILNQLQAPDSRPETGGRSWAYFGTLLGLGLSMYGNISHSLLSPFSTWDSLVIAACWPIFGFILLETISRAIVLRGWKWAGLRYGALGLIGLVSMVVSYDHLSGLLRHWGESPLVCAVGPIAIDGLMVTSAVVTYLTGRAAQGKDRRLKTQTSKTQTSVAKSTHVSQTPTVPVQSRAMVHTQTQALTAIKKTEPSSVSSIVGQTGLMAQRLQMIKDAEPDWLERGGDISKGRIGAIIERPNSSGTQQKLRELLMREAAELSTQERELLAIGS